MNIPRTEPTLEQRIIGVMRFRHYSRQTELGYVGWYKRYVLFHKEVSGQIRHPAEMGAAEVEAFLTHLAVNRDVAAATQNQALNALIFDSHASSGVSRPSGFAALSLSRG